MQSTGDRWDTYQGKNLSQHAQFKSFKRNWAENSHNVVPLVSHTLMSMSGESAATESNVAVAKYTSNVAVARHTPNMAVGTCS